MRIFAAAVVACLALPAQAMVLDFDVVERAGWPCVLSTDGFCFQSDSSRAQDHLYLHDDSSFISSEFRRPDGRRFSFYGADVWGYSFMWEMQADGTLERAPLSYTLAGYRDGVLVASLTQLFWQYTSTDQSWGSIFTDLDMFKVTVDYPEDRVRYIGDPQFFPQGVSGPAGSIHCSDNWCGALNMDNIKYKLAPIPLPASLTVLLAGLGAIGLWRRFT